jgi:hypothetical protein
VTTAAYANLLLSSLGRPERVPEFQAEHPALAWARSGLMSITGRPDGAGQMCPVPLTTCAEGALLALRSLTTSEMLADFSGAALLAERAAMAGHVRAGATSPGGSCRLLHTTDGAIALNLARDDDWALLPAWLQMPCEANWSSVAAGVRKHSMHDLVEQGRLLGLAVCPLVPTPTKPVPWVRTMHASTQTTSRRARPRVVDLSSLWAGPLCANLLHVCGADVIKLESLQRPDGARHGPTNFFDVLNAGKRSVALDLSGAQGRAQLRGLLASADIVIEASRPRALRQMGLHAEILLNENPGLTWVSLSGYGRGEPQENWIAYGDDAGVAAGLSWLMQQATDELMFVGDAIADPLTGLHAAVAAWSSYQNGGGQLLSLSLVDVVRHCIQFDRPASKDALRERVRSWSALAQQEGTSSMPIRSPLRKAAALGADTQCVLAEWGIAC